MDDRKARATAGNYLGGLTGAESPADEQGDGLAQGLMSVPSDSHCLGMQVVWNVKSSAHNTILTSVHHDALM
jgi:hypothetical protein